MDTLSPELLCRILAHVPLSNHKVQLSIVSKVFRDCLCLPESHDCSLQCSHEDQYVASVPVSGARRWPLRSLKLHQTSNRGYLPPTTLTSLELCDERPGFLELCDALPCLRSLSLDDPDPQTVLPAARFLNVEALCCSWNMSASIDACKLLLSELPQLPRLRELTYQAPGLLELPDDLDCRVIVYLPDAPVFGLVTEKEARGVNQLIIRPPEDVTVLSFRGIDAVFADLEDVRIMFAEGMQWKPWDLRMMNSIPMAISKVTVEFQNHLYNPYLPSVNSAEVASTTTQVNADGSLVCVLNLRR